MKTAIFGGTFDPVHVEHINIVKAAAEKLGADKIIVMPAYIPPHKQGQSITSAQDRLNMAKLAFAGIANCEVSAYEINAGGTSYTVRTLEHFRNKFPNDQLYWLVGADMLQDFYNWKEPENILSMATLVACSREGSDVDFKKEQKRFSKQFGREFQILEYRGRDISSTKIRALLAFAEDMKPYLAEDVLAYIEANGLYRVPYVRDAQKYLTSARWKHTIRVAVAAAECSKLFKVDEQTAIVAAGLHDVAKKLDLSAPELQGCVLPKDVPNPVVHQYTGAYLAEHTLGVNDEDILNAIRYHTSGRPNMSNLEKLIFLSDLLESGRAFPHIDTMRRWFHCDPDKCMYLTLRHELRYLKKQKGAIYPLTFRAYEYYKDLRRK